MLGGPATMPARKATGRFTAEAYCRRYAERRESTSTRRAGIVAGRLAGFGDVARRSKPTGLAQRPVNSGIVCKAGIHLKVFRRQIPTQFLQRFQDQLPQRIFRTESDRSIGKDPLAFRGDL